VLENDYIFSVLLPQNEILAKHSKAQLIYINSFFVYWTLP